MFCALSSTNTPMCIRQCVYEHANVYAGPRFFDPPEQLDAALATLEKTGELSRPSRCSKNLKTLLTKQIRRFGNVSEEWIEEHNASTHERFSDLALISRFQQIELHLTSASLLRLYHTLQYLISLEMNGSSKMFTLEAKEEILREIKDNLTGLDDRLKRYNDENISEVKDKEKECYFSEETIHEILDVILKQNSETIPNKEALRSLIRERIKYLRENSWQMGCSQGELTLAKDMTVVLNTARQITLFMDKLLVQKKENNPETAYTPVRKSKASCPCELPVFGKNHVPPYQSCDQIGSETYISAVEDQTSTRIGSPFGIASSGTSSAISSPRTRSPVQNEQRSVDEVFYGSEISVGWSSARDVAMREPNVPKLIFEFSDSDKESRDKKFVKNMKKRGRFNTNKLSDKMIDKTKTQQKHRSSSSLENNQLLFRPIQNDLTSGEDEFFNKNYPTGNPSVSTISPDSEGTLNDTPRASDVNNTTEAAFLPSSRCSHHCDSSMESVTSSVGYHTHHTHCYRNFSIISHDSTNQVQDSAFSTLNRRASSEFKSPYLTQMDEHTDFNQTQDRFESYSHSNIRHTPSPVHTMSLGNTPNKTPEMFESTSWIPPSRTPTPYYEISESEYYLTRSEHTFYSFITRPKPVRFQQIGIRQRFLSSVNAFCTARLLTSIITMIVVIWLFYPSDRCHSKSLLNNIARIEFMHIWSIIECINRHTERRHIDMPPF